jgi:CHASE2 domain-containing sensor protein
MGDRSYEDIHESVLGEVPGYLLMANYIEGLLDDRTFSDVPWWIEFAFAIVLFVSIHLLFHWRRGHSLMALVIVTLLVVQFLTAFVTTVYFGYYLTIWFPSALVVLAEFVNAIRISPEKQADGQR